MNEPCRLNSHEVDSNSACRKEHTRVLYGRNTLSSPKLWLFDDSNASLNETDAAIAQKTTSSDQNDVILQFYQIHGVISTPSMELESNSNKYDTLEACADRRGKIGHVWILYIYVCSSHFSEIRSLGSTKCSNKKLQTNCYLVMHILICKL